MVDTTILYFVWFFITILNNSLLVDPFSQVNVLFLFWLLTLMKLFSGSLNSTRQCLEVHCYYIRILAMNTKITVNKLYGLEELRPSICQYFIKVRRLISLISHQVPLKTLCVSLLTQSATKKNPASRTLSLMLQICTKLMQWKCWKFYFRWKQHWIIASIN